MKRTTRTIRTTRTPRTPRTPHGATAVLASAALMTGLLLPATTVASAGTAATSSTSMPSGTTAAAAKTTTVQGPGTVYRGKRVTFLGTTATDGRARPVVLQVWKSKTKTWKVIAERSTDTAGALTIATTAPRSSTSRRYRVTLPAVRQLRARTHTFSVQIVKAPASAAQWNTPWPADFTASWAATRVDVADDATFTVSGVLPGPTGRNRKIVVQRKHTDTWKTAARAITDATGAYSLKVPGDWLVDLQHRLYVPTARGARKRYSQALRLKSTPTWKLAGRSSDWTYLRTGEGLRQRWNPCSPDPIAYRVNLKLAPEFVTLDTVHQAVAEVAQATGLTFTYAGSTTRHAFPKASRPWPEGTDMVISWTRNGQSSQRWDSALVQGLGGITSYPGTDARGKVGIAAMGHVMLQAGSSFLEASPENTYGILKHELGHAVGLNHSRSESGSQLMNAYYFPGRSSDWGRGDLRGLRQVGATTGCTTGINWWGTSRAGVDIGDAGRGADDRSTHTSHDWPHLSTTVVP